MLDKRYLTALVAAILAMAAAASSSVTAQEGASVPPLGDLMVLTQLRHFKLWYAERMNNWKLADYELRQFETTVSRIAKLYPTTSSISQDNLIHEKTDPALAALRQAIQDKSRSRFENAFLQITGACNQCHQAAGVGFIVVQTPTKSPISNQNFKP